MLVRDIVVGIDYAYEPYKGARRSRVHVLETGVERGTRYNYATGKRSKVRNGVRVRYDSGEQGVVESRHIVCDWASWDRERAQQAIARKQRDAQYEKEAKERAALAYKADRIFREQGFLTTRQALTGISATRLYARPSHEDLREAGFDIVVEPNRVAYVETALHSATRALNDQWSSVDVSRLANIAAAKTPSVDL